MSVALTRERGLQLHRQLLLIRRFEERCVELYSAAKIRGFLHLYIGEEAVAVGVMEQLAPDDAVVATYREHGQALARGVSARSIMAEMFGKAAGCSRGRGGSMHLFDAATRFYGGNAIVGGGLPLAVGVGLAHHLQGSDRVVVCFFGDGAVAEGEFHESLNLAALWQLPVVFVCENNLYAMGTALARSEADTDLAVKAAGYELPAWTVDGMDVVAVADAARRAVDTARGGHARVPRGEDVPLPCPLDVRPGALPRQGRGGALARARPRGDVRRPAPGRGLRVARGARGHGGGGDRRDRRRGRLRGGRRAGTCGRPDAVRPERGDGMSTATVEAPAVTLTYRDAMRQAIREAILRDDRVFLMGEDVGRYGGCYAVTKGLLDELGPERIRDTPLSESAFVGAGVGAAMAGMRPIVEIMTVNFSLLALDQIMNNAATIQHMSGGQFSVPIVIRMTTGAGRQLAAQHSHSLEGWYAHIPGLKVLAPATIEDARFMLWPALEDPDPVLIFENGSLYNREGEIPPGADSVDLCSAAVRRAGDDVTLITYGGSLFKTLEAADALATEGISAEVVDLRVLRPLDDRTILGSVVRTHHAVVVDEGWRTGSLAAEVSARLMEQAFWELDAPVARVCTAEVPIPYAKHLEDAALPQVPGIVAAAREVLARG